MRLFGMDKATASATVKLIIFVLVTTMATTLLAITIGNIQFGSKTSYKAVFSDATGVVKGDDIRIAGVKVGSVDGVDIIDRTQALVSFSVQSTTRVTQSTYATIRYRNLVGQRYISLSQGSGGSGVLHDGDTIPISRTAPALDLTVLFNGFKPLFAAMTPDDINKLSYELIQVFQGEGGTLEGLLNRTASVTNTLAARDKLVGDLISNLNQTLTTVGDRSQQLSDLIIQFRKFVTGLANDRNAILGPLNSISNLAVQTSDLVTHIRPGLTKDISGLRKVTANINSRRSEVDRALHVLPIKLTKVGRTAIYGSWFNFYLCDFTGRVELPTGNALPGAPNHQDINYHVNSQRCHIG